MKVIKQIQNYRITEIPDYIYDMADLKGDCFDPEVNPDRNKIELKIEEEQFENKVYEQGVYGYALEIWNPEIDQGWQHIDSCFGFVGTYEDEKHYIVDVFLAEIKKELDYENISI